MTWAAGRRRRARAACAGIWAASLCACGAPAPTRVMLEGAGGGPLPGGLEALAAVENLAGVAGAGPRVRGAVRLSAGGRDLSGTLVGIDPIREAGVSQLPGPMAAGRPLSAEPGFELVAGRRLAASLPAPVGATILIHSAAPGAEASAFDAFTVVGVSEGEPPGAVGWVHIADLQSLLGDEERLDGVVLAPADASDAQALALHAAAAFPPGAVRAEVRPAPGGMPGGALGWAAAVLAVVAAVSWTLGREEKAEE